MHAQHARRPRACGCSLLTLVFIAGSRPTTCPRRRRYVPYYGKNQIHYNNFKWHIYTTDHFEIYYYPEIEQHLERVAATPRARTSRSAPTSSTTSRFKVPLILFKTHSEFQQQNVDARRAAGRRRSRSPSRIATAWCCRSTSRRTRSTA